MKKVLALLGAGLALVAGAVVGGAAWMGGQVQSTLEAQIQTLQTVLPVKVVNPQFQRGLFTSQYKADFVLGCAENADKNLTLAVRSRIQHGPLPGFNSVGKLAVDVEMLTPQDVAKALPALANVPFLTARTTMGFAGRMDSRLDIRPVEHKGPEYELNWKGAQLTWVGSPKLGALWRMAGELPGMHLKLSSAQGKVDVNLGRISLQGQSTYADQAPWFTAGETGGELDNLVFQTVGRTGQPLKLQLDKFKFSGTTQVDNALLTQSSQVTGQVTVNDFALKNLDIKTSIKRIHTPTYAAMIKKLWSPKTVCAAKTADSEKLAQELQKEFVALLLHNPEYTFALSAESDNKTGELSYAAGTQGITPAELGDSQLPQALRQKAYFRVQTKLPVAWVEKLMAAGQTGSPQSKAQLDAMIEQGVASGYVQREGEFLLTQGAYEKGQVNLNGKPIATPWMSR